MRLLSLLLLSALSLSTTLPAGVVAPPLADAPAKLEQGLTLQVTGGGKTDTRDARLVALFVLAGKPVTPFVPAGPFTAKWEGEINSELRGEYTFSADMRGVFKLTINSQLVLEGAGDGTAQTMNKTIQLNKGANHLVAEFESDGQGDASLQLRWWAKDFPSEPVPPTIFQHDTANRALREGRRVREGRMLFAQLKCAGCHDGGDAVPPKDQGMPEMSRLAPVLGEIGAKFRENFLAHWINDPHSIRPNALMPRTFADGPKDQVDQRAADLAAFLVTLGKGEDVSPAAENAPLGGALFANLGCIACHTAPDFDGQDEFNRVPLSHVKAKWLPKALSEYLRDPAKDYAHNRMPNFRLTEEEAERLTSYLLENAKREFPEAPKGDATKGGGLLVSAGCITCHAGAPVPGMPKLSETLVGGWTKGCLAEDDAGRGKAPDFGFTPEQREALKAFAAVGFDSLKQDASVEFATRQMANLRCTACHSRDGQQSVWSQLEGEMIPLQSGAPNSDAPEGSPVASTALPALTWTGEKLKNEWLTQFLLGTVKEKPRPWLLPRMPGFATWAHGIAEGLSYEHGLPLADEPAKVDPERQKIGEQLIGENGGFNCMQCHALGEKQATAVFEAPGPNFAQVGARIRRGYFTRWLMHPLRIDPETKMPKFADDEGKTPLTDILGGQAADQFDAIWQFLGK